MRFLLLVVCVGVAFATPAIGTTFVVDASGGGDFTTIQEATDAAANTDTVLVLSGAYVENVECTGKCLSYLGSGSAATTLAALGGTPALKFVDMPPSPSVSYVSGIAIQGHSSSDWAVWWNEHRVEFSGCVIEGKVGGGSYYGSIALTDCSVSEIGVSGGMRASHITESEVGSARFGGDPNYEYGHHLYSSGSSYAFAKVWGGADFLDDEIAHLEGNGADYDAQGCSIGLVTDRGGSLTLSDCHVDGDVAMWGFWTTANYNCFGCLSMSDCIVEGNVTVDVELEPWWSWAGLYMVHNTVRGNVRFESIAYGGDNFVWPRHFRSNIVMGDTELWGEWSGYPPVVTHNDCFGGLTVSEPPDSMFANGSYDPLFCGWFARDYHLQECSPCVGAGHDGGDIGALGTGCDCATVVQKHSWGRIKAMYRQQPSN